MNWAHLTDSNLSCPLCILVIVHGLVTIEQEPTKTASCTPISPFNVGK